MPDMEKVIYDIERCTCRVPDACRDCSHYTGTVGYECMEGLMRDALDLLEEQDAMKPISKSRHGANPQIQHFCRRCNAMLFHHKQKYCIECGQAVKWE